MRSPGSFSLNEIDRCDRKLSGALNPRLRELQRKPRPSGTTTDAGYYSRATAHSLSLLAPSLSLSHHRRPRAVSPTKLDDNILPGSSVSSGKKCPAIMQGASFSLSLSFCKNDQSLSPLKGCGIFCRYRACRPLSKYGSKLFVRLMEGLPLSLCVY